MCLKVSYATDSEARHSSAGFSRKKRVHMRVYFCNQCGAYHWATAKRAMKKHKRLKYPFKL